jgi:hypothetical protein
MRYTKTICCFIFLNSSSTAFEVSWCFSTNHDIPSTKLFNAALLNNLYKLNNITCLYPKDGGFSEHSYYYDYDILMNMILNLPNLNELTCQYLSTIKRSSNQNYNLLNNINITTDNNSSRLKHLNLYLGPVDYGSGSMEQQMELANKTLTSIIGSCLLLKKVTLGCSIDYISGTLNLDFTQLPCLAFVGIPIEGPSHYEFDCAGDRGIRYRNSKEIINENVLHRNRFKHYHNKLPLMETRRSSLI